MNDLIEIRWHGRGGQGAKTASLLLADAAFNTGKYIHGFPEYGPERMGAPSTAYNRISSSPITIHSNIYEPDYVVVVDDTRLESVNVTAGLKIFLRFHAVYLISPLKASVFSLNYILLKIAAWYIAYSGEMS